MVDRRLRRSIVVLSALVPLAAAGAAWRPLLRAYFHADDFAHLYDAATLDPSALLSQVWGGHLLTVFNALTLALFTLAGPEPRVAFGLVLATHLVNVLLLHRAVRLAGGDAVLAGAAALVWGTCPVLAGALEWYSVYGQVLLTTLVLAVAGDLAGHVTTGRRLSAGRASLWGLALIGGGASFGNGLGIAAMFPVCVALACPPPRRSASALPVLAGAAVLVLAAYVAARMVWRDLDPRSYDLTGPAAALRAFPAVVSMVAHLVLYAPWALWVGFVAPGVEPSVLMRGSVAAAAGLLAAAGWLAANRDMRRLQAALWLLFVVAYGTLAAGRVAVIEFFSFAGPVSRAALWPRYHYLGLALLATALFAAIGVLQEGRPETRAAVRGALGAWAGFRLLLAVLRPMPIDLHADTRAAVDTALATMRRAIAATPPGEVARIPNQPFGGLPWVFPGWVGLFVIHVPDDVVDGRPVRFVVREQEWQRLQERGGRIASLVELD